MFFIWVESWRNLLKFAVLKKLALSPINLVQHMFWRQTMSPTQTQSQSQCSLVSNFWKAEMCRSVFVPFRQFCAYLPTKHGPRHPTSSQIIGCHDQATSHIIIRLLEFLWGFVREAELVSEWTSLDLMPQVSQLLKLVERLTGHWYLAPVEGRRQRVRRRPDWDGGWKEGEQGGEKSSIIEGGIERHVGVHERFG